MNSSFVELAQKALRDEFINTNYEQPTKNIAYLGRNMLDDLSKEIGTNPDDAARREIIEKFHQIMIGTTTFALIQEDNKNKGKKNYKRKYSLTLEEVYKRYEETLCQPYNINFEIYCQLHLDTSTDDKTNYTSTILKLGEEIIQGELPLPDMDESSAVKTYIIKEIKEEQLLSQNEAGTIPASILEIPEPEITEEVQVSPMHTPKSPDKPTRTSEKAGEPAPNLMPKEGETPKKNIPPTSVPITHEESAVPTPNTTPKKVEPPKRPERLDIHNRKLPSRNPEVPLVFDKYNTTANGKPVIYTSFFAETKAILNGKRKLFANTRAWYRNEGTLFANTKALFKGERSLFANTKASLKKWSEERKTSKIRRG